MATNPFGGDMTDFGLIKAVDGDVLGSPSKLSELQSQLAGLQAQLSGPGPQPPQQNDFLGAAVQGALASQQGILVNPFTGEEQAAPQEGGFLPGLLAGLNASVESQHADAIAKYQEEVRRRNDAQAQREKLASGIRMVLSQNPEALAPVGETPEGRRLLGQLAYGMDIPLDPGAKQRQADETLQRKQRMAYYTSILRGAASPAAKAAAANALQDMVDPDGELGISPEDMTKGKVPTYSEVGKLYGDGGLQALNQYNLDGDLDAFMAKLGSMKMVNVEKSTPTSIKTRIDLAAKIAAIKRAAKDIGKDLTDLDAIKQLPEEDRILAENLFRNITGSGTGDISPNRYISIFEKAYDDQPLDVRTGDPDKAAVDARNLAIHRVNAARNLAKRDAEANKRIVTPPPSANAMDLTAWRKLAVARAQKDKTSVAAANAALVAEYLQSGKADSIPALARQKAGM